MQTIDSSRAVDFYVGRGDNAEYLGTEYGREPFALPNWLEFCSLDNLEYREEDYRNTVRARRTDPMADGARFASRSWPHQGDSSETTAWALCYDHGSVYVYHYGVEMQVWRCNTHANTRRRGQRVRESRPVNYFPNMRTPEEITR